MHRSIPHLVLLLALFAPTVEEVSDRDGERAQQTQWESCR